MSARSADRLTSSSTIKSEFLATAALVVLSIVLRFRGSPESRHVQASNDETGR